MIPIHLPSPSIILLKPRPRKPHAFLFNQTQDPNRILHFSIPRFMNKLDLASYLRAVYDIQPQHISTVVPRRRRVPHPTPEKFGRAGNDMPFYWNSMHKVAFVTIQQPFPFPPIQDDIQEQLDKKNEAEKQARERREQWPERLRERWDRMMQLRWQAVADHATVDNSPVSRGMDAVLMPPPLEQTMKNLKLDKDTRVPGKARRRLFPRRHRARRRPTPPRRDKRTIDSSDTSPTDTQPMAPVSTN